MEKLLQDIVSAYWWVSVVVVGIVINVISASIFFVGSTVVESVVFFVTIAFFGAVSVLIAMDDHYDAVQVKKLVEASTEGINELYP